MWKHSKRFLLSCLVVLLCIGAARFCHHQTKGFRLTKIQNNLDIGPALSRPLSENDLQLIRSLFAYPFHYLGRGKQSFAFASDDGVHVIKIFNNENKRKTTWWLLVSQLPFLREWAGLKSLLWKTKWEKAFESYRIAFDEMKDKTGLVYIHLNQTEELPPLTLIDPLRICHRIDSNSLGFLIQKKAKLVYAALDEMIQAHDRVKAERAIIGLIDLCLWKCRQGIHDNDPLIRTNFGILDDEVIQIDVGPLSKDFSTHDPDHIRKEIFRITASLKNWLNEHSPELAVFLDQQLEERLCF